MYLCMDICLYICIETAMVYTVQLNLNLKDACGYLVATLEYFSKSCVSVDNCTRISQAIHAHVTWPNMLANVRGWTHVTMHACSHKEFRSPRVTLFSVQAHETTILMCMFVKLKCTV